MASFLISASAYAAAPSYNIQFGVAAEDFEGKKETFNQLTGSFRSSKGQSRHSILNLNADLHTRKYNDADWRSSNGLLAEVIYNYIPRSGYTKPVYSFALRQEFETFDRSDLDYAKTSLILADTIRLDDTVTMTAGLEFSTKSSDLEDITSSGLFLNTDMQLSAKLIVYVNLKIQDEDIEQNSITVMNTTQLAARDDFAGHHTSGESGLPSPSLPDSSKGSDNIIIRLGSNYFFTSQQSIDISYEHNQYTLSDNDEIQGSVISLDYFYKF